MIVKICASVTASTLREAEQMIKKAERDGADLIEIRMDYAQEKYNPDEVRRLSELPMIATNRAAREGGLFEGSEETRVNQLFSAADTDFDFIDVELSTEGYEEIVKRLTDAGAGTVISCHLDSSADLSVVNSIFEKELRSRADVCKIVMPANEFEDNLTCLRFVEEASKQANVACFCTGELGIASRLLSPLFGGYLTYAAVERGREAAKGQLTVAEMRRFYEVLGV